MDEHQEVGKKMPRTPPPPNPSLKDVWSSRALLAISKGYELSKSKWQEAEGVRDHHFMIGKLIACELPMKIYILQTGGYQRTDGSGGG